MCHSTVLISSDGEPGEEKEDAGGAPSMVDIRDTFGRVVAAAVPPSPPLPLPDAILLMSPHHELHKPFLGGTVMGFKMPSTTLAAFGTLSIQNNPFDFMTPATKLLTNMV